MQLKIDHKTPNKVEIISKKHAQANFFYLLKSSLLQHQLRNIPAAKNLGKRTVITHPIIKLQRRYWFELRSEISEGVLYHLSGIA